MRDSRPLHASVFVQELLRNHGIDLESVRIQQSASEEEQAAVAAQSKQYELRKRIEALLTRGIPAKDIELIAAGELVETRALRAVRDWLADDRAPRLLVLAGQKDAGKTTACSVAVAADPSEADAVWVGRTAPRGRYVEAELLLKAWWHRDYLDESSRRVDVDPVTKLSPAVLVGCSLLAIDDVGQEPGQFVDGVAEALDVLVRLRCDRRLRTVISTNLETVDALVARYSATGRGGRLTERLTEHGLWVKCPPEGLRTTSRRKQVLARRTS